MIDYVALYARSLWKHWEKRLTGGTLMALAALWTLQGGTVYPALGAALIGMTFLAASFCAWREEHVKRSVRVEITSVDVPKVIQDLRS